MKGMDYKENFQGISVQLLNSIKGPLHQRHLNLSAT